MKDLKMTENFTHFQQVYSSKKIKKMSKGMFTFIIAIILGLVLSYLFFSKDNDDDDEDGGGRVAVC